MTRITGADVRNVGNIIAEGPWIPCWFARLADQLDDEAEAAKPKEVWRWMFGRHELDPRSFVNADVARFVAGCNGRHGHPVREVTRPDGVIELHPEGGS